MYEMKDGLGEGWGCMLSVDEIFAAYPTQK
jgi:hypothetical protein